MGQIRGFFRSYFSAFGAGANLTHFGAKPTIPDTGVSFNETQSTPWNSYNLGQKWVRLAPDATHPGFFPIGEPKYTKSVLKNPQKFPFGINFPHFGPECFVGDGREERSEPLDWLSLSWLGEIVFSLLLMTVDRYRSLPQTQIFIVCIHCRHQRYYLISFVKMKCSSGYLTLSERKSAAGFVQICRFKLILFLYIPLSLAIQFSRS